MAAAQSEFSHVGFVLKNGADVGQNKCQMPDHYWAVHCRNVGFHSVQDPFSPHKIPIGSADGSSARPSVEEYIEVSCDQSACGKKYLYVSSEIFPWDGKKTTGCSKSG
jgi:hypothetical protein